MSEQYLGWNSVFIIMSIMVLLGAAPLLKSFNREMKEVMTLIKIHKRRQNDQSEDSTAQNNYQYKSF